MKVLARSVLLAMGMAASVGANAALLDIFQDGDTSDFTIPAVNDYVPLQGVTGYVGGHLINGSDSTIRVTYEYIFREASLNNTFWVGGTQVFSGRPATPPATASEVVGAGEFLTFSFQTNIYGTPAQVDNVASSSYQNRDTSPYNFFLYKVSENEWLIALDDGRNGPDDNHDDMIIRVTAVKVPEPVSLGLMGLGLLGAGAFRRRS